DSFFFSLHPRGADNTNASRARLNSRRMVNLSGKNPSRRRASGQDAARQQARPASERVRVVDLAVLRARRPVEGVPVVGERGGAGAAGPHALPHLADRAVAIAE